LPDNYTEPSTSASKTGGSDPWTSVLALLVLLGSGWAVRRTRRA
jgi:LPXTG-motif cell wall-anchored protein